MNQKYLLNCFHVSSDTIFRLVHRGIFLVSSELLFILFMNIYTYIGIGSLYLLHKIHI